MADALDLNKLPEPLVVESLDFERILAARDIDFRNRDPVYDATVESDPAFKLLEEASYRELLMRQRINEAAQANLLAKANGSDLDQLASFYGVVRLPAEPDDTFRLRVKERIMASSTAGGASHYRYQAMSVSEQIRDVAVDSPQPGLVRISVLSWVGNGLPDDALLNQVIDRVMADDVKVLTDTVLVVPAEIITIQVTATVYLTPQAPLELLTGLNARLATAIDQNRGLGWDLSPSWIDAKLHELGIGIQRVELSQPSANVSVSANQCVSVTVNDINLTYQGRNF